MRDVLVTSLIRRLPNNLWEEWDCALPEKEAPGAHMPMSLQKPLLEGKEAAKGKPQNNH